MARNKKRKKKKTVTQVKLKPENYIKKMGRKLPIYECRIDENWQKVGMAQVFVSRQRSNGELVVGVYLTDVWCTGLKDTFFREGISTFEYEDWLAAAEERRGIRLIKCEPALAFNVVYGAIEYAEDLGFEPAKDFKITEYLLDDVESIEFMEIEFGQDGKPHFMAGPRDNINRTLSVLDKSVGPGNYYFTGPAGYPFDEDSDEYFDVEEVLPFDKIDKKMNSLEDDHKQVNYMLQTGIARKILTDYSGDLADLLEFGYEEEYLEEVANEVSMGLAESALEAGDPWHPDEQSSKDLSIIVEFMLDKALEHGNFNFLLEKNYEPAPKAYSQEELEKMTPEEFNDYENYLLSFQPVRLRDEGLLKKLARIIIYEHADEEGLISVDDDLRETIMEQYFQRLKEILKDDEKVAENRQYFEDLADQTIKEYNDMRPRE